MATTMEINVTEKSKALFIAYAKDADNWVRGLRRIGGPTDYRWVDGQDNQLARLRYCPTSDHNQSRELLDWFVREQRLARYAIWSGKLFESVCLQAKTKDGVPISIEVNGTSARAQTIAFCAAMTVLASQPTNATLQRL